MTISTQRPRDAASHKESVPATFMQRARGWLLILMVFVAGAASLAIEFGASRLLAADFGDSLFVWASLIGLILLYLTIGYYVGGLVADRYPRPALLYALTLIAALLIALVPLIARPVLNWSLFTFAPLSLGIFYGSLVAVLLLFALPTILLGCVSPLAIRLRVKQVGTAGRTVGYLYAISTLGSIVGTFVPVLWLLPTIGTNLTFLVFALLVGILSLAGMILSVLPLLRRTFVAVIAVVTKNR
ncbi:MAG: fused MFS/spermidine synthase [Ktedonobacteraceae bacterium]